MSTKHIACVWALLASLALAWAPVGAAWAEPEARYALERLEGRVEVGHGEPPVWRLAREGEALGGGVLVRTGAGAKAELVWAGRSVRLYERSMLRLPEREQALRLERGHSLVDVVRGRQGAPTPFRIETPEIVAAVKGTRFFVSHEGADANQVAVFEGEVAVRALDAAEMLSVSVREGFALQLGRGMAPRLYLHGASDPWQAWAAPGAAPPPLRPPPSALGERARELLREAPAAFGGSIDAHDSDTTQHELEREYEYEYEASFEDSSGSFRTGSPGGHTGGSGSNSTTSSPDHDGSTRTPPSGFTQP